MSAVKAVKKEYEKIAGKYFEAVAEAVREMLRIPSPSGKEEGMAEYVSKKMRELGYDEVKIERAGSVVGLMKGTGGGKSVMLNCHLDVVDEGPH